MSGETAGPLRGMGFMHQASEAESGSQSPYSDIHDVVWGELEDARAAGYREGLEAGYRLGYVDGWTEGYLAPDPPPIGTLAHRALERDTVREALWPTADTLAAAVAAHLRELERKHHRGDYGAPHTAQTILGNGDGGAS